MSLELSCDKHYLRADAWNARSIVQMHDVHSMQVISRSMASGADMSFTTADVFATKAIRTVTHY